MLLPGPRTGGVTGPFVIIVCKGAAGSGGSVQPSGSLPNDEKSGGDGAVVIAVFRKSDLPASLMIQVGQGGQPAMGGTVVGVGGWPAGGDGGADGGNHSGGAGGGRSGVFNGSVAQANALVIAGEGAGGGSKGGLGGDGGGGAGEDGTSPTSTGYGRAGTQLAGGTGGLGADGSALAGANGSSPGGGGGGDGYFGGEGGTRLGSVANDAGGGGGGSGYISPLALTAITALTGGGPAGGNGATGAGNHSTAGENGQVQIIDTETSEVTTYSYTGSNQTTTSERCRDAKPAFQSV